MQLMLLRETESTTRVGRLARSLIGIALSFSALSAPAFATEPTCTRSSGDIGRPREASVRPAAPIVVPSGVTSAHVAPTSCSSARAALIEASSRARSSSARAAHAKRPIARSPQSMPVGRRAAIWRGSLMYG